MIGVFDNDRLSVAASSVGSARQVQPTGYPGLCEIGTSYAAISVPNVLPEPGRVSQTWCRC